MEAKHTATPWMVDATTETVEIRQAEPTLDGIFQVYPIIARIPTTFDRPIEQAKQDAEFIVRACNVHDDLVSTLKIIKSMVDSDRGVDGHDLEVISLNIRAALAKAREG